ncbi:MAG TPA: helix-turn-helix domain-containing protein [Gammaproteobacteria bacterium]|nr:helix-turn-helix domain-containing protein [Gammaproteobacteria bacterium]
MRPSKRELVLETAERLFYEEGFHATGIDRLASEAGVVRMTLYNHFPSKDALIEAVLERRYARYMDDLRDAIARCESRGAIKALAERHCDWLREHASRGCMIIKAIGEFEQHNPAIAGLGRRLKDELLVLVADAVEQDTGVRDTGTSERILVILEGANALVPILGADPTIRHVHSLLAHLHGAEPAVHD